MVKTIMEWGREWVDVTLQGTSEMSCLGFDEINRTKNTQRSQEKLGL